MHSPLLESSEQTFIQNILLWLPGAVPITKTYINTTNLSLMHTNIRFKRTVRNLYLPHKQVHPLSFRELARMLTPLLAI